MLLGSCWCGRVSRCPQLPIPSPHPEQEAQRTQQTHMPWRTSGSLLSSLHRWERKAQVTFRAQRAEPRQEPKPSQVFPVLTALHPLAFTDHLPPSSGPPDVRKEPGASHRQKWQDLEL